MEPKENRERTNVLSCVLQCTYDEDLGRAMDFSDVEVLCDLNKNSLVEW